MFGTVLGTGWELLATCLELVGSVGELFGNMFGTGSELVHTFFGTVSELVWNLYKHLNN